MSTFDHAPPESGNKFIKNDPNMLQNLFGTVDVTPFWVADMEFPVADPIQNELRRLVDRGVYSYEFDEENIFRAIVKWNERRHGLALATDSFLQVPGVMTGIAVALAELTDPGDGVLIQPPVYHQFTKVIRSAGRKVIENPLRIVDGRYEMDFEGLEQHLEGGGVKAILLCNPHNPVGRVWRREELQQLVATTEKHRVTIISDEIHSDIVYPGHPFTSIASLEPDRYVALLGSPAKTFGMQSIANGYLYTTNQEIREQLERVVDSMYLSHGNAFTTFATIAGFDHGDQWLDELLVYLKSNIDWIERFLAEHFPKVHMFATEGTYQVWLDFGDAGYSADQLAALVFDEAKQGLTPGDWFGGGSDLFLRMNIACPLTKIQDAFNQIKSACDCNTSRSCSERPSSCCE